MGDKLHRGAITNVKDYAIIVFGLALYAVGFTAFILPHHVVMGGLPGVGTLVYFASGQNIPVALTQYICNLILLAIAFRVVGKTFVLRTVFGATVLSLFIGFLEFYFMGLGKPLIAETSISVILGGILCFVPIAERICLKMRHFVPNAESMLFTA